MTDFRKGLHLDQEYARYREEQARNYLQGVRDLFIHVRCTQLEISTLRETAEGITGIDYSKLTVKSASDGDAIPRAVADLIELIGRACAELAECVERQGEANRCLDEMGGTEASLLKLRYVLAKPWKQVAHGIGYSESRAKHLERDALCCFYDFMPAYRRDPKHPAI